MTESHAILLVDDHVETRELLADLFDSLGYRVLQAENGRSALDQLARGPLPQVVVADMNMPVMGGESLLAEMRNTARLAEVPLVVLSGDYPVHTPDGAVAALSKPVDVDRLVSVVRQACGEVPHAA